MRKQYIVIIYYYDVAASLRRHKARVRVPQRAGRIGNKGEIEISRVIVRVCLYYR